MASLSSSPSVLFTVKRQPPMLLPPSKPTPHEFKPVSDIDDQESLRFQVPVIQFYRMDPSTMVDIGRDPARVIKEALGQALVYYYPFAGRLREFGPGRKLVVECTGEGIMFIEADADVALQQFGDALQPPFPCLEELLYDVPGSEGVLGCPLILIQVTRLTCGGFILALRLNHVMSDAAGLVQFMMAVAELARGARAPSIRPVWRRELLNARDPPRITCIHREYVPIKPPELGDDNMVVAQRSFFFAPHHIAALRSRIPHRLRSSSTTFELLTACLWKCRTAALRPEPHEEVKVLCIVNARSKFFRHLLPAGYYGNAFVFPAAVSSAGKLSGSPLGYALDLVRKAKSEVGEEYVRSVADFMALRGRPPFVTERSFVVSDVTRAGFPEVDFGWGKAVYGGPAAGVAGATPAVRSICFYVPFRHGIVIPVCLPGPDVMDRFAAELQEMVSPPGPAKDQVTLKLIKSPL